MDPLTSFLLTLGFLSISLCILSSNWIKQKMTGAVLPPGKMGWPIVGETLEFLMFSRRGSPEKFVMDRMNSYSPEVFKTSLLGENFVVFCGASGNKFLFSNEDKLVTSWWPRSLEKVLNSSSSNAKFTTENKKLRGFVSSLFNSEALQNYIGIMDSLARKHIETECSPGGEVLGCELSKKYTFDLACRVFLSIEDPRHVARIAAHFKTIMDGILHWPINFPGTPFNRSIKAANNIRNELLTIIRQRKMDMLEKRELEMSQDILTHMLLSTQYPYDIDLANRILGLIIAGYNTTSTVITFIIKYLAELPHVYAEVLKEQLEIANTKKPGELLNREDIQKMKYSWSVANEAMRLRSPSQGSFREATTNFTYAGFTIPKGWKILWTVHSTHKNPEYFTNPETFDPSRFLGNEVAPYSFTPFGGGPRMCVGKEYARFAILAFMYNLVTKFKWEPLIPDEEITYKPAPMPAKGLPILLQSLKGEMNYAN